MDIAELQTKCARYEAALKAIAREIKDQATLEEHQRSIGIEWRGMHDGRAISYTRVSSLIAEALGDRIKVG